MKKVLAILCVAVISFVPLAGCSGASESAVKPLIGLEWFSDIETVKSALKDYTLLEQRDSDSDSSQIMLDYKGTEIFDVPCDVSLCFVQNSLVGFNYHDTEKNKNYYEWFTTLEDVYGIPTESGNGMASWYSNPVGSSTALYLFNLAEGVQVSVYATDSTPDMRSDDDQTETTRKANDYSYVPSPEIRTPVVPVPDDVPDFMDKESLEIFGRDAEEWFEVDGHIGYEKDGWFVYTDVVTDRASDDYGKTVVVTMTTPADMSERPRVTAPPDLPAKTTAPVTESTETVTTVKTQDRKYAFLANGLSFYGSPETEKRKMSSYTQSYEYNTEEKGQPWEYVAGYRNVSYDGGNYDAALCFTSVGLVGITYFENASLSNSRLIRSLLKLYGKPDFENSEYIVWNNSPVGDGTSIYIFVLEDGIQVSFFADDKGSEIVR